MGFKNAFGRFFGKNSDNQAEELIEKVMEQIDETQSDDFDCEKEQIVVEQNEQQEQPEEVVEEVVEDEVVEETVVEETTVPKKSFFSKLLGGLAKTRKSFNDKIDNVLKMFGVVDEELFEELEEALIMADVGVDTSLYIIEQLRLRVKEKKIKEPEFIKQEIEEIISDILAQNDTTMNLETTPSVIMVIGVNGVGKTTSIGKMAARYKAEGKKVILGAADTFRAAAIDQLAVWATRSGVDIVKHQEGSDPAAVVFDTITAAKARGADVIILDTAGRLHNKKNLMDELNKIYRVMERELPGCSKETLLVVDATTGQNAVNQVKLFGESTDISGIILTKLDGSAKGGIVLAIAHEENIPVKLVGVGESVEDLQVFDSKDFASALFAQD
jgi:fused signal recognition particle receptor